MGTGTLTIDLAAIAANWRALDAMTRGETGAVVKADAYGLGVDRVAPALAEAGARRFFVAQAEEGAAVRQALGDGAEICVFSGHMAGDAAHLRDHGLVPLLNSPEQAARHRDTLPGHPFGVQLDTGMNRLGIEPGDWAAIRGDLRDARLVISHLACSDDAAHPQNADQLGQFRAMIAGIDAPCSLAATGGILLGPDFHFDLARPGIGLFGGMPFASARPVVRLSLPVIQTRRLAAGESVGYGASWTAEGEATIATVSAGYADGLIRHLSNAADLYAGPTPCRLAGRVSMDLLTVDVSQLPELPDHLDILNDRQTIDVLADAAGTIGYEILTSLGSRYARRYVT